MSITGKGSKSIRKLPVAQSLLTNTGFKVTRALHEASEGDTLIQLGSLTAPSTAVNYSAPNPSELTSTNIMAYQDNVRLSSSLRGLLMKNLAWIANGASTIKLLFEAEEAEVFEIIIDHNARTSVQLVDASSQPISGTLAATQSDFNIGVPFEVGKFSAIAQVGVYAIHLDGQLMNRNTGNNPPGPGVTGDYYEVHAGAGLGTLIRFNNVDLINDRAVIAIPVGALVERPNGSQLALIEALQGQIDAIVPHVAATAGVDETDLQATPNNIDLAAFGNRVLQAEADIDSLELLKQDKWLTTWLKDYKANTTAGGTFTSGAYQTRILNTQEGDTSFCVLASNQFTLTKGIYQVEIRCPAFAVNQHKAKLRNITDSTDTLLSISSNAASGTSVQNDAVIVGTFTINSSKVFEVQHRATATAATFGFGQPSSFGEQELYTVAKIVKVG
jgi:hypothetical protein